MFTPPLKCTQSGRCPTTRTLQLCHQPWPTHVPFVIRHSLLPQQCFFFFVPRESSTASIPLWHPIFGSRHGIPGSARHPRGQNAPEALSKNFRWIVCPWSPQALCLAGSATVQAEQPARGCEGCSGCYPSQKTGRLKSPNGSAQRSSNDSTLAPVSGP